MPQFDKPQRNYTLRDPLITAKGKLQCQHLSRTFTHHGDIDIIFSSPLRRTIQTAAYSFGPTLARKEVPFVLLPGLQEVSDLGCDVGPDAAELEQAVHDLFDGEELGFDWKEKKIDFRNVESGWNSKVCLSIVTSRLGSK